MPLFKQGDIRVSIEQEAQRKDVPPQADRPISVAPAPQPTEEPDFLDTSRAFFKMENPVFNMTKGFFAPEVSEEFDPSFDPITKLEEERPDLLERVNDFAVLRNEEEYRRKVFDIDYENEQRQIFQRAPTMTKIAGGLAGATIDPLVLIPYVGIAKKANTAVRVGTGVASGVTISGASAVTREAILQTTQETRTKEESMTAIVAETAIGGLLGGVVGAFSKATRSATSKTFAKALEGEDLKISISGDKTAKVVRPESKGLSVIDKEFQDLGLARIDERLAKIISGPEFLQPPDLRAITSPSTTVRSLGETFFSSNYIRNKNIKGMATKPNAQNAIFRREQNLLLDLKALDDLYLDHVGTGSFRAAVRRPSGKISHADASRRAASVLRTNVEDSIPQVNKMAKLMRERMNTRLGELQGKGLIPDDLDPDLTRSYLTRVYDTDKLLDPVMQNRFATKVGSWLETHDFDGALRQTPIDEGSARDLARKHLEKVRRETDDQVALRALNEDFISKGKFVKKRHLLIPDEEIAEFLENDSFRLYKNYMSKSGKLLETQDALERAGFDSIESAIKEIQKEGRVAAAGAKTQKEAVKIGQQFKNQEEFALDVYRSMLGQLRKPGRGDRYIEALLNYQYVRLLGGVTISSFPEAVMTPFRQGFAKTLRDGYLPMARSLKTSKIAKDQLNDLAGALEAEQANILRALGGVDNLDDIGRTKNTFDRAQDLMTSTFSRASGIGYWTNFHRRIAGHVAAADIVRTLQKGPTGKDVTRLATIGIEKGDYDKLLRQINKHVDNYEGSFFLNPQLWDDSDSLRIMQNAIQSEIESAILKPGVESLPLFVQQHLLGKVIFQFKSFMSSATGKILISGIQRRDSTVLTGLMALIAMGSLTGVTKDLIAGREPNLDVDELIIDGLSRSGVLGLLGDTILGTAKTLSGPYGRLYGSKSVESALLGPSVGQIEELVSTIQRMTDGKVTNSDTKAALRMIPYMNLFYIKAITDRVFPKENK